MLLREEVGKHLARFLRTYRRQVLRLREEPHTLSRDLGGRFPVRIFCVFHEKDLPAAGEKLRHPLFHHVQRNTG